MPRAIDSAPPTPDCKIQTRRWWNQICINSMVRGIPSGCPDTSVASCGWCNRCKHRNHMVKDQAAAFIGFTPQNKGS